MRKSEKFKVAASAAKGGALAGLAATGAGLTSVKTTVFFGLITTGSVLSLPLLGAYAAGGAVVFGSAALASQLIRKKLVKQEVERMMASTQQDKSSVSCKPRH
ncbi:hypothetical protein [Desulfonatronum thiodismutans]|uniref:hypothetical protein n=1 Tax=Desulfonatronum thiodismutans TaxID=159290 RepID=UPI0004ABE4A2|nr:hypothetical protein [Desulfonatronum thiodismutans]